jgi:hypothetical protein
MNKTIEIEFAEETAVEIPAITNPSREVQLAGGRRQFWIGWQLFGAE